MVMQLMQHQKDIISKAKGHNLLLAWDCGTGKTLAMLEILKSLHRPGFKVLVVCPILVISNAWVDHIENFTDFTYSIVHNTKPEKRITALRADANIYLINYEQFKSLSEEIRGMNFDMLIIDESSKLKANGTAITKCSLSFAGIRSKNYPRPSIVPHRYCLSGTPSPNGRHEYWGQVNFLQPGLLHPNYFVFRDQFFYSIPIGPGLKKWEFKKSKIAEFESTIAPAVDVALKDDCLDLPEMLDVYYTTELSNKEIFAYAKMKEELVLELGDITVLSQYQITKIQKLRQLACGFVFDNEKNVHWIVDKTAKDFALLELMEKLAGRSVVIWADFRPLYSHIRDLIGGECGIVDKEYGDPKQVLKDFTAGKIKVIVANPASCGHGINQWQNVASESIYYTNNWSWELRKQTGDRLHRIGQQNKVTNYHIVSRSTVDVILLSKTTSKKDQSDAILKHLKKGICG